RSRPRSRPCGRNSIRSTTVSRRTPRPIAAGVWLEDGPVREDRLREPPEALLDADARLRARVQPGPPAFLEERLDLARRELGIRVEIFLVHQAERGDVPVIVLVEHGPPDERRLPYGRFAGHAELQPDRGRAAHGSTSSARSQADCPASVSPRIRCNVALKRQAPG